MVSSCNLKPIYQSNLKDRPLENKVSIENIDTEIGFYLTQNLRFALNDFGNKKRLNLMEVNLTHKEKISRILDCNRNELEDGDKLQDYIIPFLKEGRFYGWPYLAVSKEDMLYQTPAWGMSSNSGNDAIESCEQYNDGKKCEVIIERGYVVSDKFYRELIKTIPDSNSSGSSNDDIEIIGAGS